MSKRIQRVNQLIKKELGQILLREVEFPENVLVTITRVETTPNLIEGKVFVSVMPEDKTERILQVLKHQIYDIQQKLNKRLKMRPLPRIYFVVEKETAKAGRIEEILEELKKEEK